MVVFTLKGHIQRYTKFHYSIKRYNTMLRRAVIIGFLSLFWAIFSARTTAQNCDTSTLSGDLHDFSAQMNTAESASDILTEIARWLGEQQEICDLVEPTAELEDMMEPVVSFSSNNNDSTVGPITLEDGFYRIRLKTEGMFFSNMETQTGICEYSQIANFYKITQGQASEGTEILLRAENCEATINIDNAPEPWTLDVYQIDLNNVINVAPEYNSQTQGAMPVVGPFKFKDGNYKVTVKTDMYFVAEIKTLSGMCKSNNQFGFLVQLLQVGATEAGNLLTTKDCVGFISIGAANAPWTLTFEPIE